MESCSLQSTESPFNHSALKKKKENFQVGFTFLNYNRLKRKKRIFKWGLIGPTVPPPWLSLIGQRSRGGEDLSPLGSLVVRLTS